MPDSLASGDMYMPIPAATINAALQVVARSPHTSGAKNNHWRSRLRPDCCPVPQTTGRRLISSLLKAISYSEVS